MSNEEDLSQKFTKREINELLECLADDFSQAIIYSAWQNLKGTEHANKAYKLYTLADTVFYRIHKEN